MEEGSIVRRRRFLFREIRMFLVKHASYRENNALVAESKIVYCRGRRPHIIGHSVPLLQISGVKQKSKHMTFARLRRKLGEPGLREEPWAKAGGKATREVILRPNSTVASIEIFAKCTFDSSMRVQATMSTLIGWIAARSNRNTRTQLALNLVSQ